MRPRQSESSTTANSNHRTSSKGNSNIFFGKSKKPFFSAAPVRAKLNVNQEQGGIGGAGRPVQLNAVSSGGVLQRQAGQQQAGPEIKLRINWFTEEGSPVETNKEVAALAKLAIMNLQDESVDISSSSLRDRISGWINTVRSVLPYFERKADNKVEPFFIQLINSQYDELIALRAEVHDDKLLQLKEALWREHDAAVQAAEEAEALQPALDDTLRVNFRKGSISAIKEAVSAVKGAISIGRNLRSLSADIVKDMMGLPFASGKKKFVTHWSSAIGTPRTTIINVGKYTDMLGKLGRGLNALSAVIIVADRSKKATEPVQAMKDLSDIIGGTTDAVSATTFSMPPHFSLYTTMYLKPALKIITKQMSIIVENASQINRVAVDATGNLMYPEAETGGQEMFDLMVKVMHAEDDSEVATLSGTVQECLFDHGGKLAAGTESNIPTQGILLWKHLDGQAGRAWLFANRKRIWAMFYGSMIVPAGKS